MTDEANWMIDMHKKAYGEQDADVSESRTKDLLCGCCLGEPINDKPCICGGTGTQAGELQGLHARIVQLENALRPFARFACSEENTCTCHNCVARDLLNK